MKIAIASDHGGVDYKAIVAEAFSGSATVSLPDGRGASVSSEPPRIEPNIFL